MSEPRRLFFHDTTEAERWQKALDDAGIEALCIAWDEPFQDARGYWQPPRSFYRTDLCEFCGKAIDIYWVDGFWIRNNITVEYVDGGHHHVYDWIPENTEYIEPANDDAQEIIDEMGCIHLHESHEEHRMEADPMVFYEEAHGLSQRDEREFRTENYADPRVTPLRDTGKPNDGDATDAKVSAPMKGPFGEAHRIWQEAHSNG